MADLARISLNQITTKRWTLAETIAGCADVGIRAIGVWRDGLAKCGVDEAGELLDDHGMVVSGLCRGGFFTAADQAGRDHALQENMRALDEALSIGAQCLVLVSGGLPEGSKDISGARQQVRDGLGALLPHARAAGVPLALEPIHPVFASDRSCINTLAEALDVCDELGDGLGVAVDTYHVWWDPDLEAGISRAGSRILAFHVNDWLHPTGDPLYGRGMMGDGIIDIPRITGWVTNAGYGGPIEIEIFSKAWWARPPSEVVRMCIERFIHYV